MYPVACLSLLAWLLRNKSMDLHATRLQNCHSWQALKNASLRAFDWLRLYETFSKYITSAV